MIRNILICIFAVLTGCLVINSGAQGTEFSYQGQLDNEGVPANGNYDLVFSLYDASTNGNLINGPLTNLAVSVNSGLFTTELSFGDVFTGTNYWLAIGVRASGSTNAFTGLQPLQPLLPTPYAVFANTASNLTGSLPASQISGTLTSKQLSGTYSGAVSFTNLANSFSGLFAGTGSGLTSLNGSQISSGTVADARLSTNVAFLNGNQKFSGSNVFTALNIFTNRNNTFIGNFFGNGLVGWIPVSVTSTQAAPDAGYLLLSSNLTTVTLPPTSSLIAGDVVRVSGGGTGGWEVAQNTNQAILGSFSGYSQTSWLVSSVPAAVWIAMASSASGGLMAAVESANAPVYISNDYGYSWSPSGSQSYTYRCVACSADGSHLIAGQATAGSLFYSSNYGGQWTAGSIPSATNWIALAMSANGMSAVALAYPSGVYTSANGGVTWQQQSSGLPGTVPDWFSVASSANGSNLVAVGTSGAVYTSSNAGSSWTGHTVGSGTLYFTAVTSSSDGTKLAAVVAGGGIYTSVNSGVTWQQSGATTANYYGIASSSDGAKLAATAYNGSIYTSINFGATWAQQSAPSEGWFAICGSSDGSRLAAGVNNGNIYYTSSLNLSSTTVGTNGYLAGPQFSSVELQYLGNGQFMPISSAGTFWAN